MGADAGYAWLPTRTGPAATTAMMDETIDVDVAIVGAGVAGLWLANLLSQRGLAVAVCEAAAIGGVQTAASQGIVHGGWKYALGGRATAAVNGLRAMPARWRAALAGCGEVDLRGVPVLAERLQLWHTLVAAPRALAASRLLDSGGRWAAAGPPYGRGLLRSLGDFVIDVGALVRRLAVPIRHRVVHALVAPEHIVPGPRGLGAIATASGALRATAYVLAAGAGNAALAAKAGFGDVAMVRRPLRQASVRLSQPAAVFAHCLVRPFGTAPDLTITSHGRTLYLGGRIASAGLGRPAAAQIAALRRLLARTLPALDLAGAEFRTHAVDRAEPAAGGHRQGDVFVAERGNCLLCWPGKLSLAPRLGDVVAERLAALRPRRDPWRGHCAAQVPFAAPPYLGPAAEEAGHC